MKKSNLYPFFISLVFSLISLAGNSQLITVRASSTATATTTSITINKPAGTLEDDVMIAVISKQGNSADPGTLTGWTKVAGSSLNGGSTAMNTSVFYKIAGASEGTSYTFSLGNNTTNVAATIVSFFNVDVSSGNPFDLTPATTLSLTNTTTPTATSITTQTNNAAVIMCGGSGIANAWSAWSIATSPATSLTELADVTQGNATNGASVGMAWARLSPAGATGAGTATISTGRAGSILLALKPLVSNLWASYNRDNTQDTIASLNVASGSLNWGPLAAFTASFPGTSVSATSIGSLGRNTSPNQSTGNYYWVTKTANNNGVVELYGATYIGGTPTKLGSIDMINGNTSATYVAMAIGDNGTGYILAGNGSNAMYLATFNTGSTLSAASTTLTMVDNGLTINGTSASTYKNGDICLNGDGKILALGNDGAGATVISSISVNGSNSTMSLVLTVKAPGGSNFSGTVNGVAYDLIGNLYIAASTGLYYLPKNIVSGYNGTANTTLVWSGTGLTDLASNYFPNNIIVPVPVKLGDLNAKLVGTETVLNWNTLTEINSHRFEIERSTDGIRFSTVGSVNAAGNSTDNLKYQYNDPINGLTGVVYYRLKTVDIDAKFEYSKIVAVRLNGAAIKEFSVYPNPCVDNIKISVSAASQTAATIRITNMAGQQVVSKNITLQQGDNILVLSNEISTLKPGMHMLELISSEGVKSLKIIKK